MNPAAVVDAVPPLARPRAADYVALTKPRIALVALFSVAAGFLAGCPSGVPLAALLHTLFGTALVAAGASVLNMVLERHTDGLMRRTAGRPLPAGRLHAVEALLFGLALGVGGVVYLAAALPGPGAAAAAALTLVLYAFVYTPLKPLTELNTLVGAVPGALPPVIGWAASPGADPATGLGLFLVLFVWQMPHFMAIAWLYRADYGRAGLRMVPVADPTGRRTSRVMLTWGVLLLPVGLVPALLGQAGWCYAVGSLLLGGWFLAQSVKFALRPGDRPARRVLRASLVYLPALLLVLLIDAAFRPAAG